MGARRRPEDLQAWLPEPSRARHFLAERVWQAPLLGRTHGLVVRDDAALVPLMLMQFAHQHVVRLIPGFTWGGPLEPPP
eukprot:3335764-Alexandrium_andersonii.AAC.1